MKSQLETGSESHRASVHTRGHPSGETSHVWANSLEPMLLCDLTPHPAPPRDSLSNTSEDSTKLGSPGGFTARPRHQLSPGFYRVGHEQRGRVRSGHDKAFQGQRNGSSDPSPGPHALSPSSGSEGTAVTHPAPCVLLETTQRDRVWLFPQPKGFRIPKQPSVLLPYE